MKKRIWREHRAVSWLATRSPTFRNQINRQHQNRRREIRLQQLLPLDMQMIPTNRQTHEPKKADASGNPDESVVEATAAPATDRREPGIDGLTRATTISDGRQRTDKRSQSSHGTTLLPTAALSSPIDETTVSVHASEVRTREQEVLLATSSNKFAKTSPGSEGLRRGSHVVDVSPALVGSIRKKRNSSGSRIGFGECSGKRLGNGAKNAQGTGSKYENMSAEVRE